ncbi:MAG TPA: ribonuclease P protein component [Nevskiaceae bacterium]|nr:ribonuclease P protein component [Nevskiaceae bacterium]
MIHQTHRFHGRGSFRFVYQHGQTVRGPLCTLKFIRNSRRDTYRVAVVVSRKVHKSAVVRNRIRRRMYEAVRKQEPAITRPYDLVFTVFSDQLATMEGLDLQQMVCRQLQDAKVIDTKSALPDAASHAIVKPKER